MRTIIRCHTLFDITSTGILNRKTPINIAPEKLSEWEQDRNRQTNFDTIVQVVSLRTQPEDITKAIKSEVNFSSDTKFGFLFDQEENQPVWSFDFTIYYAGVYNDGIDELGALYQDCNGVPMIKINTAWDKLPNFLDTTPELRNIYFEVLSNE
jgi:hypothetical protein